MHKELYHACEQNVPSPQGQISIQCRRYGHDYPNEAAETQVIRLADNDPTALTKS